MGIKKHALQIINIHNCHTWWPSSFFYEFGKIVWVPCNSIIQPLLTSMRVDTLIVFLVGSPSNCHYSTPPPLRQMKIMPFIYERRYDQGIRLLYIGQKKSYVEHHNDPICISSIGLQIRKVYLLFIELFGYSDKFSIIGWYIGNRVVWTICKTCNLSNSLF